MQKQIITAKDASVLIKDGWTITTGGFGSCGHPEMLTQAIEERFRESQSPRDLTLVFAAGQGDKASRGLNRLAHEGLVKKVIGGYWALTPRLGQLAKDEKIEAYNWPQGVVSHLFRAIAGGKPGVLTDIGLHTFIDPRNEGGRLNQRSREQSIELITLGDKEHLFYPSFPIHCALLRGTRADTIGNISMEEEANFQDSLAQAQAVHNSGGIVIVQVRDIVEAGSLPAHQIRIPGIFVDYLVHADEDSHWQTYGEKHNPSYTGAIRSIAPAGEDAPLSVKKIIARRAYLEILKHSAFPVINIGIGAPEYIAKVAQEEGPERFTLTVESGVIGGTPAGGMSFGASRNPLAILDQPSQFDFYDGGGIDYAFLGCGEVDHQGNVNVSYLGDKLNGVGGFVNISQSAQRVVFCGAFTASGLEVDVTAGKLNILKEGSQKKFVEAVSHLSFNAAYSARKKQEIMYITERAVFTLVDGKLCLCEVAPGIDIEKDIVNMSDAEITVGDNVRLMASEIFFSEPMRETNYFMMYQS